jgi:hypothetical protein
MIGYVIFMAFAYWYVNRVLKEGDLKVTTKEKETVLEVKPVDVKLIVDFQGRKTEYKARLQNVDTVRDFLDNLHDKQQFTYERSIYSDGVRIDEINGIRANASNAWVIKIGNKEITNNLDNEYLKDGSIYDLTLVQK